MSAHRIRRQLWLRQAEGYLELGMARHALDTLARYGDGADRSGRASYLRGEALRSLGQHEAALRPLRIAARRLPERTTEVGLALGWCYKRTGRLDKAIAALEHALAHDPRNALLLYNLACYWSLAGNTRQVLLFLSRALAIDGSFRDLVADESDFDNVRLRSHVSGEVRPGLTRASSFGRLPQVVSRAECSVRYSRCERCFR